MFVLLLSASALGLIFFSKDAMAKKETTSSNINNAFDDLFQKYASIYSLDWKMLKRISWIESRVGMYSSVKRGLENPKDIKGSVSQDGKSWGIMQVTLSTAKGYDPLATEEKLNNAEYSIKLASQHLKFLKNTYPQFKERDIVMSYNHGQGNQLKFLDKEKAGTLKLTEFVAGRDYFNKYKEARRLIP